jgi:hypothetical protein
MPARTSPPASTAEPETPEPAANVPSGRKRRDGIQPGNKTILVSDLKAAANEFFAAEVSGDEVKGVVRFVNDLLNRADQNSGFATNFDNGIPSIAQPLRYL